MKVVAWNVALSTLLALAALAGLEGYLRYSIPPMREGTLFEYTLESKRYKVMKPNADMRVYGVPVRTNNLGFRDNRAAIPAKRAGEFRIVVLGDSFAFGPGVEYERIFTSGLQQRLMHVNPEVQVINLAVEGYNVVQYEAVLEEVGLSLEPDLVLVALFPVNDFEMDTYENNRRVAEGHPPHAAWHESLYVYRAYLHRVESAAGKLAHRLLPVAATAGADEGWEKNIAALTEIHRVAKARGVPVAVLLLPHTRGFETQREIFGRVAAYCHAREMHCLDLLAVFLASGVRDGALILNQVDAHGNAEYHRLVAELVAPYVSTFVVRHRPGAQAL